MPIFHQLTDGDRESENDTGDGKGKGRDALQPGHRQGVGRERNVGLERIGVPPRHRTPNFHFLATSTY